MVALITGHRGFLGAFVDHRLREEGWQVVGAGRPEMEIPSPAFSDMFHASKPALVVHLAGPASVRGSVDDPEHDRFGSIGVLEHVVELARSSRLILVSSAAVYGQPDSLPITESTPLRPMSPYGRHRVECERIVAEQHAAGAVLRVFSAYGEGLRRQVLFDICSQARSGRVLLGGNGTETRDFVHASDVARAVALAARNCLFDGTTYNVGTGVETSIERLAMLLVESLGWPAEIAFSGLSRPGDPDRWRADVSRMRALGFEPEVTIEDGAARYARWFLTA